MRIIEPGYEIMRPQKLDRDSRNAILSIIEAVGRTCYKSEDRIGPDTAADFVKKAVARKHYGLLEHATMTVRWTVDIGVGRQMVRHRIASYAQESTRYCNYAKDRFCGEITFVRPVGIDPGTKLYEMWRCACRMSEILYMGMIEKGAKPEIARNVLPLSTRAELVSTMNLREWRHFFKLRAADETGRAHPQMKQVTIPLLEELKAFLPEVFGDIEVHDDGRG